MDKCCKPIPVEEVVPIEIMVEHGIEGEDYDIYYEYNIINFQHAFDPTPTGFHLFVKNGYVAEVEVFSLGGDTLDLNNVCLGKRYYFIYNA